MGCVAVAFAYWLRTGAAASTSPPTHDVALSTRSADTTVPPSGGADSPSAFSTVLSQQDRRSLLLGASDVAVAGLSIADAAEVTTLTPRAYARQYSHQSISPSRCDTAKGLLVFADGESGSDSIERTNDLVWPGNSTHGSQQIRQFESEGTAVAFMNEQRSWFEHCSRARFSSGASRIDFSGSVYLDSAPNTLLATAVDAGAPWSTEFDGWVREGTVVYAAYLLGDTGTTSSDLQRVGSALMSAASAKLHTAG